MTRSRPAALAAVLIAAVLVGTAAAPALAEPGTGPGVTDPPQVSTEATVVAMRHQSGLFGSQETTITDPQTPYPTTITGTGGTFSTAQIVLNDPRSSSPGDILTYCIDLATETEIGVHYELGDWTSANVPNLDYVTYILNNYYPVVPGAPALSTDAEKVAAVQGAIWYFTDQFVVPQFGYPAQHAAIRDIVQATQTALAGGSPPAPPLPTLTITPDAGTAPTTGDVVGPFAVGGSVSSSTIEARGVDVFSDPAGTVPVPDGASVAQGSSLWTRYASTVADEGFTLETSQTVEAGNVFLYDGGNPGRTSAQKLILAAQATIPIRASAAITPMAAGWFAADVTVAGSAAGLQSAISVTARCDDGTTVVEGSGTLAAGAPAGTTRVVTLSAVPAGSTCTLAQTADGHTADAVLTSTTTIPASVIAVANVTVSAAITDTFAAPTPTPTPSPTSTQLPDTGAGVLPAWQAPAVLLAAGLAVIVLDHRRRRSRAGREG